MGLGHGTIARMSSSVYRLQNLILLLIIVLLALNILLPARYSLQLVRLVPSSSLRNTDYEDATAAEEEEEEDKRGNESILIRRTSFELAPVEEDREYFAPEPHDELDSKPRSWSRPTADSLIAVQNGGGRRMLQERKPQAKVKFSEKEKEFNVRGNVRRKEEVSTVEQYNSQKTRLIHRHSQEMRLQPAYHPAQEQVNLHDPAQRMAYYRSLRKQLMEREPPVMQHHPYKRSASTVGLWEGWFEEGEGSKFLMYMGTAVLTPQLECC